VALKKQGAKKPDQVFSPYSTVTVQFSGKQPQLKSSESVSPMLYNNKRCFQIIFGMCMSSEATRLTAYLMQALISSIVNSG
jgi:hypothetical protein